MPVITTTRGNPQASDIAVETALPVVGTASRNDLQSTLTSNDSLFGQIFEDRNVKWLGGGTLSLSSNGQTLTFGERLDFSYNLAGTWETVASVVLAAGTLSFTASGQMAYITLNRSGMTAALSTGATTLPPATTAQEVFLLAIRRDDISGVQRVYLPDGNSISAGGTLQLGQGAQQFPDASFDVYNSGTPSKILNVSLTGSSTSTTTTIATSSTANHTLTLPNTTDTLTANAASQTLTNKTMGSTNTLTGALISSFTPDGTHTLTAPGVTDTLTANASSQTLSNKTLLDTTTVIANTSDTTKQLAVSVSGNTTGKVLTVATAQTNTETLSIPNVGSGDSVVTNNTTATLTNKTMGSTNTLTGSQIASFTPDGTHTLTAPTATDTLTANATAATLTNKTVGDAIIFTEISTPANPSAGFVKVYSKSGNNLYMLTPGGAETEISNALTNPMTVAGDMIYENGTPAPARLPIGTTNQVLTVVAGAPAWASSPIVVPGTSAGLVSASGVPGNTTGNVIATGYVGQVLISSFGTTAASSSGLTFTVGSAYLLPAGVWLVSAMGTLQISGATGNTYAVFDINTTATLRSSPLYAEAATSGSVFVQAGPLPLYVNVVTSQNIYFLAAYNYSALSSSTVAGYMQAVRIA